MLELEYRTVVNAEPIYIEAGSYPASATSPRGIFINKLTFHIRNDLLLNCYSLTKCYISFDNEEAVMKFFLSFDQNAFFNMYDNIEERQKKEAMASILKQAKELNW